MFLLLCIVSGISGYKILGIFPLHIRSHHMMFEQLMKNLARNGHEVHVISPYPVRNPPANYTNLFEFSIDVVQIANNFTYQAMLTTGISKNPVYLITHSNGNNLCEGGFELPGMQKLIKESPRTNYDVVLTQVNNISLFYFSIGILFIRFDYIHIIKIMRK